jgi:hypothetical protein
MPLAFLLDENLRGLLWRRIQRHNARGVYPIDIARVGDPPDLPLAASDSQILLWAEHEHRIIVSRDERTFAIHLLAHITSGHRSPGIFMARVVALETLVDFLVCAAYASEASEWENQVTFIP